MMTEDYTIEAYRERRIDMNINTAVLVVKSKIDRVHISVPWIEPLNALEAIKILRTLADALEKANANRVP